MKEKERYAVKKISKDCLFPKTLCELKDTKSKFFVVLESKDDAVKIADLLNQQDKRIKELEEENQQLKQSQKQLAIEELKKLESELVNNISPVILSYDDYVQQVFTQIDNQIKELRGEE